jgi:hypothetical protein
MDAYDDRFEEFERTARAEDFSSQRPTKADFLADRHFFNDFNNVHDERELTLHPSDVEEGASRGD